MNNLFILGEFGDPIQQYQLDRVIGQIVVQEGRNRDVDAGTEDVIDTGASLSAPNGTELFDYKSGDVNDAAAGTGARTFRVTGVNAASVVITEDVTLNGTTVVAGTVAFTHVHSMVVLTAGSGATNAGAITATGTVSSNVNATIVAGANRTYQGVYWVPSGKVAYILATPLRLLESLVTAQVSVLCKVNANSLETAVHVVSAGSAGTVGGGASDVPGILPKPVKVTAGGIITLEATSSAADQDVWCDLVMAVYDA